MVTQDHDLNEALDGIESNSIALGMLLASEAIYKATTEATDALEGMRQAVAEVSKQAQELMNKYPQNGQ